MGLDPQVALWTAALQVLRGRAFVVQAEGRTETRVPRCLDDMGAYIRLRPDVELALRVHMTDDAMAVSDDVRQLRLAVATELARSLGKVLADPPAPAVAVRNVNPSPSSLVEAASRMAMRELDDFTRRQIEAAADRRAALRRTEATGSAVSREIERLVPRMTSPPSPAATQTQQQQAPVPPPAPVPSGSSGSLDDAALRFSLLELDLDRGDP